MTDTDPVTRAERLVYLFESIDRQVLTARTPTPLRAEIYELVFLAAESLPEDLQEMVKEAVRETAPNLLRGHLCECGHPLEEHTGEDESCTREGCNCMFYSADR